jgi:hypothetical protein
MSTATATATTTTTATTTMTSLVARLRLANTTHSRARPEIISEPPAPTDAEMEMGQRSPFRPSCSHVYEDGSGTCFRTRKEEEDLGNSEVFYDEDEFVEDEFVTYTPEVYGPKPLPRTKATQAFYKGQETKRLRHAIIAKLGKTDSGPSSPTFDRWNDGYASQFREALRCKHVWEQQGKRKRSWHSCTLGCHWCVVQE